MTINIQRSSEPYTDFGNVSGQGARSMLGTPKSDPIETAIRESVQNSWDARLPDTQPRFVLTVRHLNNQEIKLLREEIFKDLYSNFNSGLKQVLDQDDITVLDIADFGTYGLNGPKRPSEQGKDQFSRFVKFFRNIGGDKVKVTQSGGTYGYGKSSLYCLSKCETIVVDSLVKESDDTLERRFMAARIGEEYHDGERHYTGRHWWGVRESNGVVDPVEGEEAEILSECFGMPQRVPDSTGTTITILEPDLGEGIEDLRSAAEKMVRVLLWYVWPKMVAQSEEDLAPMSFEVFNDKEHITIPDPDETAPFACFAEALRKARNCSHKDATSILSLNPKKHLGCMAIGKDLRVQRPAIFYDESEANIPEPCHHIALMRPVELVVKYMDGNKHPDSRLEWAGVFICSDEQEVETAFARSEPPAHDDWVPHNLPSRSRGKTYVNVALYRIREKVKEIIPELGGHHGEDSTGFARSADVIGKALLGAGGDRAVSPSTNGSGRKGGDRKAGLRKITFSKLTEERNRPVATFEFELTGPVGQQLAVTAFPVIVTEGQDKLEVSPSGETPQILRWKIGDTIFESGQDRVKYTMSAGKVDGSISISVPADNAIIPRLKVQVPEDD